MARDWRQIGIALGMPPKMADNMIRPWLQGKLRELGFKQYIFDREDVEKFINERITQRDMRG